MPDSRLRPMMSRLEITICDRDREDFRRDQGHKTFRELMRDGWPEGRLEGWGQGRRRGAPSVEANRVTIVL